MMLRGLPANEVVPIGTNKKPESSCFQIFVSRRRTPKKEATDMSQLLPILHLTAPFSYDKIQLFRQKGG